MASVGTRDLFKIEQIGSNQEPAICRSGFGAQARPRCQKDCHQPVHHGIAGTKTKHRVNSSSPDAAPKVRAPPPCITHHDPSTEKDQSSGGILQLGQIGSRPIWTKHEYTARVTCIDLLVNRQSTDGRRQSSREPSAVQGVDPGQGNVFCMFKTGRPSSVSTARIEPEASIIKNRPLSRRPEGEQW